VTRETREAIKYIYRLIYEKNQFIFWFFIRIISVLIPPLSVYLFSQIIRCLETNCSPNRAYFLVFITFISYLVDNFLRLLSVHKLQYLIYKTESHIQKFFTQDLQLQDKKKRHQAIQTIRNFSDATRLTMEVINQPGIDGFVSLFYLPTLVFFLDFRVFILQIAYILVYFFTDEYTTGLYAAIKEDQNKKIENYYGKLQSSNDISLESSQLLKQYHRLCAHGFWEWFSLQNTAVVFFSLVLTYLVYSVVVGNKQISDIFLLTSYLVSTQVFLNSISLVKDRLADTKVAIFRLSKNKTTSVDFDDLTNFERTR
jgi:ABC-type multidrug transport system fused ATPase/permease subunit